MPSFRSCLVAALLALVGGASTGVNRLDAQETKEGSKTGPQGPQLVWPAPPEEARIKWVAAYSNEYDIGSKKRTAFLDRLAGKSASIRSLQKPISVAVDDHGVFFVGDNDLGVVRIDLEKKKMWLFNDVSPGICAAPTGLAVDSKFVYVADSTNSKIEVFDKEGHLITSMNQAQGINRPVGIAVDEEKDLVVVVNGGDHSVRLLTRSLKPIKKFGSRGPRPGQFNFPTYCCILPGLGFAVVDTMNFRVQCFTYEGKFVRAFGGVGQTSGSFALARGIAAGPENTLLVVDSKFSNFQVFRPDGQLLTFVGSFGMGPGRFQLPCGIATSKDGSIYVVDSLNARIQRFQFIPASKPQVAVPPKGSPSGS